MQGTSNKLSTCKTCGLPLAECTGHFGETAHQQADCAPHQLQECTVEADSVSNLCAITGYIRLMLPVFHIGYLKKTIAVLACICKTCSRVLLDESHTPDGALSYLSRFRK